MRVASSGLTGRSPTGQIGAMKWKALSHVSIVLVAAGIAGACGGGDGGGSPAQRMGVGAECTTDSQCPAVGGITLHCLTQFKGGYCGLADCTKDADCPLGSLCVTEVARNYCFLECTDKAQCNIGRSAAYESNCSSSVLFVDGKSNVKACVPPS